MDIWDDLIDGLWPEDPGDEDSAVAYLRKRLEGPEMRRALDTPLSTDLGARATATMQNDWAAHYRFTYGLIAAFVFAPEDPAQWFVDAGLNKYHQKARDVVDSIAILDQRLEAMASLLPERQEQAAGMNSLAREWIIIQANPAWVLARWVMQVAIGLREAGDKSKAGDLLRELPEEHMTLLQRYRAALEILVAAGKQAALEAIDRSN
jgi:hypothetical protein